jgi:hypothetical protein
MGRQQGGEQPAGAKGLPGDVTGDETIRTETIESESQSEKFGVVGCRLAAAAER